MKTKKKTYSFILIHNVNFKNILKLYTVCTEKGFTFKKCTKNYQLKSKKSKLSFVAMVALHVFKVFRIIFSGYTNQNTESLSNRAYHFTFNCPVKNKKNKTVILHYSNSIKCSNFPIYKKEQCIDASTYF